MTKLGVITIGQAPRKDVAPILREHLPERVEMIQAGVLDGLSKEYIAANLCPEDRDYTLTSRLTTGESVIMGRSKIQPILQQKIYDMENQGVANILLLCTGVFPGLATRTAYLIEPDHIIPLSRQGDGREPEAGRDRPSGRAEGNHELEIRTLWTIPGIRGRLAIYFRSGRFSSRGGRTQGQGGYPFAGLHGVYGGGAETDGRSFRIARHSVQCDHGENRFGNDLIRK